MVFSNTFSPFLAFPVRSLVVSALAAASLAACSHTTRMAAQPQNLPVPAEWANATAPAAAPATALASDAPAAPALDLAQWWQGFGDAQLVTLIAQALAANPSIVSAQAAVQQARAQVEVQRAGLLPSLDASAGARRSQQGMADASNNYTVGLDASWELDLWGRKRNLVQAGQENLAATQASLYAAHVSLSAEVALHYIQLRNAQERLRIAQHNLALQAQTELMTRWRVQAGLAARLLLDQPRRTLGLTYHEIRTLLAKHIRCQLRLRPFRLIR